MAIERARMESRIAHRKRCELARGGIAISAAFGQQIEHREMLQMVLLCRRRVARSTLGRRRGGGGGVRHGQRDVAGEHGVVAIGMATEIAQQIAGLGAHDGICVTQQASDLVCRENAGQCAVELLGVPRQLRCDLQSRDDYFRAQSSCLVSFVLHRAKLGVFVMRVLRGEFLVAQVVEETQGQLVEHVETIVLDEVSEELGRRQDEFRQEMHEVMRRLRAELRGELGGGVQDMLDDMGTVDGLEQGLRPVILLMRRGDPQDEVMQQGGVCAEESGLPLARETQMMECVRGGGRDRSRGRGRGGGRAGALAAFDPRSTRIQTLHNAT